MVQLSSLRRTVSVLTLVGMIAGTASAYANSASSPSGYTTVTITDGKEYSNQGTNSLYVVTVSQNAGPVGYVDVMVTLPPYTNTVYPDKDGRVSGNRVIWDRVAVSQGERKMFTIAVNFSNEVPEGTVLQAVASVGGLQAIDTTTVSGRAPDQSFFISVTDNKEIVYPGENLTYNVRVRNTSSYPIRTNVTANVTSLASVKDITPAANISYPIITWRDVEFQPDEVKIFTFSATMKKRVAPYTGARVIARVGSYTATDTTVTRDLHGDPVFMTATQDGGISSAGTTRSSSIRSSSSSSTTAAKSVLFRNIADSGDVVPGGTIRYTILVQNVLLNVIRDAVVTERFDPSQVTVLETNGGTIVSPGVIQWKLPVLQPGQTWKAQYSFRVATGLPNGTRINSVATLSGNDVNFATLSDKVTVATTSVVGTLPATGGAFDLLFVLLSTPLAFAGMLLQRRLS